MLCLLSKKNKNNNLHTDKKGTKAYTIHDWNEKNSFLNLREVVMSFMLLLLLSLFFFICSPSHFIFFKVREIPQHGHKNNINL